MTRQATLACVLAAMVTVLEGTVAAEWVVAILEHPKSQVVNLGDPATLAVSARGFGLRYQWFFNDQPIQGATEPTYDLGAVQTTDAGEYYVMVAGPDDWIPSERAVLTVNRPPQLTQLPPLLAEAYKPFEHQLAVSDPDDQTPTVTPLYLPAWLHFDAANLRLSGTPNPGGPEGDPVVLTVSDGICKPVTNVFRIWVTDIIRLTNSVDVETTRRALIDYIWGTEGWPTNRSMDVLETNLVHDLYASLLNDEKNLLRVERYVHPMPPGIDCVTWHFLPRRSNGRLFVYHSGHSIGGFLYEDVEVNNAGQPPGLVIPALIREGYSVLAFDMPFTVEQPLPLIEFDGVPLWVTTHDEIFYWIERPFRFFVEGLVVGLNYVQDHFGYQEIYMMGLSGGGWTTTLCAALDPRIQRSFPVAGSIPNYLRVGFEGLGDAEQDDPGLYRIANYKELYVLGAFGDNRLQLQILNRYDTCCFYGDRHTNWVDEVQAAVGHLGAGRYEFSQDRTHDSHLISPYALDLILASLPPFVDPIPDLVVEPDAPSPSIHVTGIAPGSTNRPTDLIVTAHTDNPELLTELRVEYVPPERTATLHFAAAAGRHGTATLVVTVRDPRAEHLVSSRSARITVLPPNQPPIVEWLTPADGTSLLTTETIPLDARAMDLDGSIVEVQFLDGATVLATFVAAPYVYLWTSPPAGVRTLSAVARDDRGGLSTSTPVVLTIRTPPLEPAHIESIRRTDSGQLEIRSTGSDGFPARLEASDDLTTWEPLENGTFQNGSWTVLRSPSPERASRFYRVRVDAILP